MALGAIEMSTIARTPDITAIKHNQEIKGMVDQANYQGQVRKAAEEKATTVHQSDNAEFRKKKYDAKEKGNGTYSKQGNGQKKKREVTEDGKVIVKQSEGFDLKI